VLEGVQRVVVDEDADRPLRRQQVGQPIDRLCQRIIRRMRQLQHRSIYMNIHI
jgi:hypothetical protein